MRWADDVFDLWGAGTVVYGGKSSIACWKPRCPRARPMLFGILRRFHAVTSLGAVPGIFYSPQGQKNYSAIIS